MFCFKLARFNKLMLELQFEGRLEKFWEVVKVWELKLVGRLGKEVRTPTFKFKFEFEFPFEFPLEFPLKLPFKFPLKFPLKFPFELPFKPPTKPVFKLFKFAPKLKFPLKFPKLPSELDAFTGLFKKPWKFWTFCPFTRKLAALLVEETWFLKAEFNRFVMLKDAVLSSSILTLSSSGSGLTAEIIVVFVFSTELLETDVFAGKHDWVGKHDIFAGCTREIELWGVFWDAFWTCKLWTCKLWTGKLWTSAGPTFSPKNSLFSTLSETTACSAKSVLSAIWSASVTQLDFRSVGGGFPLGWTRERFGFEIVLFCDEWWWRRLVILGFCDDNGVVDVLFLLVVAWDVTVPVGAAGTTTPGSRRTSCCWLSLIDVFSSF